MSDTGRASGDAVERGVLIVFAGSATKAREQEFNEWYDDVHLADVLGVPGFTAAARFRRLESARPPGDDGARPYLAIYEVEAESLDAAQAALAAAVPEMEISDAMSRDPRPVTMWFREITARREAR